MRPRPIAHVVGAPAKPAATVVVRVDGALWAWLVRDPLVGIRLPAGYAVPETHIQERDKDADDLVRQVDGFRPTIPTAALPVERGDVTTIGGMTVDTEALDAIESLYPSIIWRPARRWLAGRTAEGELVAIWRMTENVTMTAFIVTEFEGQTWACNEHFCVRVQKPEMLRQIRRRQPADAAFVEKFKAMVGAGAGGMSVRVTLNRSTVDIGPISVPAEQFRTIRSIAGPGLEWRATTSAAPAFGFRGGQPAALIMPLDAPTPPSRRSS
jgi:hypothetical protein